MVRKCLDMPESEAVVRRPPSALPVTNVGLFDLNLLTMFDVLMRERNVTRTGRRLGLSQPAASHALSRLRDTLNDELFVRTPDGMKPTPRALEMAEPVRDALRTLQSTLTPAAFDPAYSSYNFKIVVNAYAARVTVPPLVQQVIGVAPGVSLDINTSGAMNMFDQLDSGSADVALDRLADVGERFRCIPVVDDDYVVLLDRQHPAAAEARISVERLADVPHVSITSSDDEMNFVDEALKRHGMARKIAVRVPYLSLMPMLRGSDRLAVLPRRAAQSLMFASPLIMKELPFPSPRMELSMIWHRRLDGDRAQRWLRNVIRASVALGAG